MLGTHEKTPTLVNTGIFTAKCDQSGTRMNNVDKRAYVNNSRHLARKYAHIFVLGSL